MRGCRQAGGVAVSEGCGREVPAAEPLCDLGAAAPGLTSPASVGGITQTPLLSTPWFPQEECPTPQSCVRLPFLGGVTFRRRRVTQWDANADLIRF